MKRGWFLISAAVAGLAGAAPARADPCTAPPSRAGETFDGLVRYVGDGDSLCVGRSQDPTTWIEVRLADFDAPELHSVDGSRSKALLERVALGRPARCIAARGRSGRVRVYDRVIATCQVGDASVADQLRRLGAPEGGN